MTNLSQKPIELPFPAGAPKDLKVSFEFFPPKTDKMAETLWA
jgi:methylenetetrahydrofolate reductase (NADPH)